MKIQNQKISNGVKFSTLILLFFAVIFAILILGKPTGVFAEGQVCPPNTICLFNPLKATDINGVICGVMKLLLTVSVPIAIIMIIWGGIQIMTGMTTGEKESKVVQGKKTLMWAVIGFAIVFAVNFLIGFVLEILGGPGFQNPCG